MQAQHARKFVEARWKRLDRQASSLLMNQRGQLFVITCMDHGSLARAVRFKFLRNATYHGTRWFGVRRGGMCLARDSLAIPWSISARAAYVIYSSCAPFSPPHGWFQWQTGYPSTGVLLDTECLVQIRFAPYNLLGHTAHRDSSRTLIFAGVIFVRL